MPSERLPGWPGVAREVAENAARDAEVANQAAHDDIRPNGGLGPQEQAAVAIRRRPCAFPISSCSQIIGGPFHKGIR